jgi:hypothetical protein
MPGRIIYLTQHFRKNQKNKLLLPFKFNIIRIVTHFLPSLKPGIQKKYLLLVAAVFWTFAGGMLLVRGFSILKFSTSAILLKELGSMFAGILFYTYMFSKISLKHITRIRDIQEERPCIFSFFNGRSYLLMSIMITAGITLRLSGLVPIGYLSLFYIAMGTPLLISALRFYTYAIRGLKKTYV